MMSRQAVLSADLRVAIVGAGPAGFYAADRILRAEGLDARVTVLDRLPTPWGLVRAGVAPDHPKIKSVTRVYEKTARLDGFRFAGGVEVGTDVTHDELLEHHHAVLYAHGASADRRLGIPGEDLRGSHAATDFVAWYNGHPDGAGHEFDLSCSRAVVVGNGNVALDVARMLVLADEELARTDTADHALRALAGRGVEEVVVLGRRGPAQAAYTLPELRELGELDGVDVVVEGDTTVPDELEGAARRSAELVREYASRPLTGAPRRLVLRFFTSPVELVGEDGRVSAVRTVRNELVPGPDGALRAQATGEEETLPCGLVLRSVGYRGTPIPGLPFDERTATIPNRDGRVLDPETGEVLPGAYTAGWIKRGPSGVIGTNKKCANATVDALLSDHATGRLPRPPAGNPEVLRGAAAVDWEGWGRIDAHEVAAGEPLGRPRVKVCARDELLALGRGVAA